MRLLIIIYLTIYSFAVSALDLLNLETKTLLDNKTQIMLEFNGKPKSTASFALSDPAQLVFDFSGVENKLPNHKKHIDVTSQVIRKLTFAESADKLRLIIDASNNVSFDVNITHNKMIITFENDDLKIVKSVNNITCVDFKRTESGAGQLVLEFTDQAALVDVNESAERVIVKIQGATISNVLARNYDVRDFATIVDNFAVSLHAHEVIVNIHAMEGFDKILYQLGNKLIIELSSLKNLNKKRFNQQGFTGDKISLNYQDISVRKIIQIIADFTNLNIIASDSVGGNITLRMQNIPWDQALDFILKSKALVMTESQGVYLITPQSEIAANQQAEMSRTQLQESGSILISEYVNINYAKAADLVKILKSSSNSWLSSRGQVSSDDRTNLLMIKDIPENVAQIKALIKRLDIPVRQVLIESQIVLSTDDFTKGLGIRLGGGAMPTIAGKTLGISTSATAARQNVLNNSITDPLITAANAAAASSGVTTSTTTTTGAAGSTVSTGGSTTFTDSNPLFFDSLTSMVPTGVLGFALGHLPGNTLLDLELQAGEIENKSKTISKPKLITLDKVKASIEQGTQIPYPVNAGNGLVTQEYKSAVLKLEVTPQISPDDSIFMDLLVEQDSPNTNGSGLTQISTMHMSTSVSVSDGQTIVLGGIFNVNEANTQNKVPFLNEIPIIGKIFKSDYKQISRNELLIFITPKIVRKS
jgi:type IV pilus assembly protein PilQ